MSDDTRTAEPITVMVVEDSRGDYALLRRAFQNHPTPTRLIHAETLEAARGMLARSLPNVVVLDVGLPDGTGLSLLEDDRLGDLVPSVVMTSQGDEETAALAIKLGAMDYIAKSAGAFVRLPDVARKAASDWHDLDNERAMQRKAAAREAALNRAILDTAEAAILVLTPDLRVLRMNRFCEQLLGMASDEAVGRHILDLLVHDQGAEDSSGDWLASLWSGTLSHVESRWRAASGERRLLSWSNTIVENDHGSPEHVVCVALDITEARQEQARLEAQIQRAQRLESIGILAGGIAHDFNNALSAIVGYTQLALTQTPSEGPVRGYLSHALAAADRSAGLVRQILTFSRQTEQDPRPMQLQPIVKEALKFLNASTPSTIEVRASISPDCPAISADPTQMHQIVMNLLTNAVYAMGERGGLLEVALEQVDVDASLARQLSHGATGPHARLTVRDNGCGISAEHVELIFDPFFSTKPQGEGTGLGLAVTYGIVQSHGGAITVRSAVGKGTEFSVYIPIAAQSAGPHDDPGTQAPRKGTERILFVDDEPALASLGAQILTELGYAATSMPGGPEALRACMACPGAFDLVVTDYAMPHITGVELARAVRSVRPDMPIVVTSGLAELAGQMDPSAGDTTVFLYKPFGVRDLAAAVRQALDQGK